MVSLFAIMKTEGVHSVAVYEVEPPRRGFLWSKIPRIKGKKSLRYFGRLALPDLLLLGKASWLDVLLGFNCGERLEKALWTIMDAAKLDNHQVVDWFTRTKMREETIVVHVVRAPENADRDVETA